MLLGLDRNMRGLLKGSRENLAASGHAHPHFQGTWKIQEFVAKPDGTFDLTARDFLTLVCGPGVKFEAQGIRTAITLRALDVEVIRGSPPQEEQETCRPTEAAGWNPQSVAGEAAILAVVVRYEFRDPPWMTMKLVQLASR